MAPPSSISRPRRSRILPQRDEEPHTVVSQRRPETHSIQEKKELEKAAKEIDMLNSALETAAIHHSELEARLEAAFAERDGLRRQMESTSQSSESAARHMAELEATCAEKAADLDAAHGRALELGSQVDELVQEVDALANERNFHQDKAERFCDELTRLLAAKKRDQAAAEFRAAQVQRAVLGAWRSHEDNEAEEAEAKAALRRALRLWRENALLQRDGGIILGLVEMTQARRGRDAGRAMMRAWREHVKTKAQRAAAVRTVQARHDRAVLARAMRVWTRGRVGKLNGVLEELDAANEVLTEEVAALAAKHSAAELENVRLIDQLQVLNREVAAARHAAKQAEEAAHTAKMETTRIARQRDEARDEAQEAARGAAGLRLEVDRLHKTLTARDEAAAAQRAAGELEADAAGERLAAAESKADHLTRQMEEAEMMAEREAGRARARAAELEAELDSSLAVTAQLRRIIATRESALSQLQEETVEKQHVIDHAQVQLDVASDAIGTEVHRRDRVIDDLSTENSHLQHRLARDRGTWDVQRRTMQRELADTLRVTAEVKQAIARASPPSSPLKGRGGGEGVGAVVESEFSNTLQHQIQTLHDRILHRLRETG